MSARLAAALLVGFAYIINIGAVPAWAETEEERRERIEKLLEQKRTEQVVGTTSKMLGDISKHLGWYVDYGGSVKTTYTGGGNNDRTNGTQDSQEHTWEYEGTGFLNLTNFTKTRKFRTSLRTTYTERKKNAATTRGNDYKELEVDALYYEMKFKPAKNDIKFTVGGQFVSVGRSIAYSGNGDGFHFNSKSGPFDLTMFAVRGDRSQDDIDPGSISPPSRPNSHRSFYGFQLDYNYRPIFKPYIFFVHGDDRNPDTPLVLQTNQKHLYEPDFYGFGVSGSLTRKLSYFGEFIRVGGKTYNNGDTVGVDVPVDAFAYDVGLRYTLGGKYRPSITLERMFGSGDGDHQTTVNSSYLGNRSGAEEMFRPFGGVGAGYAFAPTLANIFINRAGISFYPFANATREYVRDTRAAIDYFYYQKHISHGPVSDLAAAVGENGTRDLGQEVDLDLSWKVLKDVSCSLRLGKFIPGSTFTLANGGGVVIGRGGASEHYIRFRMTVDI